MFSFRPKGVISVNNIPPFGFVSVVKSEMRFLNLVSSFFEKIPNINPAKSVKISSVWLSFYIVSREWIDERMCTASSTEGTAVIAMLRRSFFSLMRQRRVFCCR